MLTQNSRNPVILETPSDTLAIQKAITRQRFDFSWTGTVSEEMSSSRCFGTGRYLIRFLQASHSPVPGASVGAGREVLKGDSRSGGVRFSRSIMASLLHKTEAFPAVTQPRRYPRPANRDVNQTPGSAQGGRRNNEDPRMRHNGFHCSAINCVVCKVPTWNNHSHASDLLPCGYGYF